MVTLGRSSIVPCESGLETQPGDVDGALATMVLDGDLLEVHNKDEYGEIVLNGRFRKPFGTKLRLRHGDTLTVGEIDDLDGQDHAADRGTNRLRSQQPGNAASTRTPAEAGSAVAAGLALPDSSVGLIASAPARRRAGRSPPPPRPWPG